MSFVIRLHDVSKGFAGTELFSHLNWEIEQGRTYGLVGANGAGKSVLLRMMCGFVRPDDGRVEVDSRYLDARRSYPDRFGVTIDGPAFQSGLSAFDNLMELARIRRRASKNDVRDILETVGLDPRSRRHARAFSLGMKQKLSLAQAFMEAPEVLLLDEPFNALDEASVTRIKRHLRALQSEGKTIVFTSHVRTDIDDLCDTVAIIRDRAIVEG